MARLTATGRVLITRGAILGGGSSTEGTPIGLLLALTSEISVESSARLTSGTRLAV